MSAKSKKPGKGQGKNLIECRRTGMAYQVGEHRQCPYCFGDEREVASKEHGKFCDFEPGKDPINFGFPEDNTRRERG